MNSLGARKCRSRQSGFSLIELGVVVVVVSLLLGVLLVPLNSQVDIQRTNETRARLATAKEALYAFAIANGRLPCAAGPIQSKPEDPDLSTGFESLVTGDPDTGKCTYYSGYLPGTTLGLTNVDSKGRYMDGWWSNLYGRMRYAVATVTKSGQHIFTSPGGIKGSFMDFGSTFSAGLWVCSGSLNVTSSNCGADPNVTALSDGKAVAVIYSLGKNAPEVLSGAVSPEADEAINQTATSVFVMHEASSSAGNYFDDHVEWISVYAMISHLVNAGVAP